MKVQKVVLVLFAQLLVLAMISQANNVYSIEQKVLNFLEGGPASMSMGMLSKKCYPS